jgi:predicted PurR-regulated permease PerM
MAFPDRRTSNVLLTILLFAGVLLILYLARRIIIIFIFSILFAYLIDPVVRFLQRHSLFFRNLRGPHIAEAYLAFLVLVALFVHGVVPGLLRHAGPFFQEAPALMDGLSTGEIATRLATKYQWSDAQALRVKSLLVQHREDIRSFVGATERLASTLIGAIFVIPILSIFFLSSGERLTNAVIKLAFSGENYQSAHALAGKLDTMFRSYIRAKVILAILSLLYCSAAMFVLGFPYAITLGILVGILEFIPVAGWMISAAVIITAGVLTNSHWIIMAALLGLWRMVMDYGISPRVVGHELEMHPLMAIFAVMVGGEIGGIVGIYLAIPFVATVNVVLSHYMPASSHLEPSLPPQANFATEPVENRGI